MIAFLGYYNIATAVAQIVTPTFTSLFINAAGFNILGLYAGIFSAAVLPAASLSVTATPSQS